MNTITIFGNVTKDVEVFTSANGKLCARYTIASNQSKSEKTDFIPCMAFGKNAEWAQDNLRKGSFVKVVGSLNTYSYQNREGNTIHSWNVNVSSHSLHVSKGAKQEVPPFQEGFEPASETMFS